MNIIAWDGTQPVDCFVMTQEQFKILKAKLDTIKLIPNAQHAPQVIFGIQFYVCDTVFECYEQAKKLAETGKKVAYLTEYEEQVE